MSQQNGNILFRETQQFRQKLLWILVLSISIIIWYVFFRQICFGVPFPFSWATLYFFWLMFGIGFPLFFYLFEMVTEVNSDRIEVKFFPIKRFYYFRDLQACTVKKYEPPVSGGWGIMPGAITVSGNWGIELKFKNNEKMFIGSQRPEELAQAIENAIALNSTVR